ncbi:MAG: hypothetical protein ABSB89_04325 [Candidatus Bathyarchaeia archaeon]|jgi:hypothetical protein
MNKKKTSMKRSTLGLVIICFLLVAALGGIIAYYMITIHDKNNQLNTVNGQLTSLISFIDTNWTEEGNSSLPVNTVISELNATINELQVFSTSQIVALTENNTNLAANITTLNGLLSLSSSSIWVNNETVSEPAGGMGIAWYNWTFPASYAGYVTINVSSASADAWARTEYSAYGVSYSNQADLGTNGTASFPILPSSNITVGVGNENLSGEATQTVTITYYY